MYIPVQPHEPLSQGDIIRNVIFTYIPDISNPSFFNRRGDELRPELAQPFAEEVGVLGNPLKSFVLVLTQSCDIDNRPFINVARVIPLDNYDPVYRGKGELNRAKHIKNEYQRAGVRPTAYYLQESEEADFPKSVASLLEIHTIRQSDVNNDYLKRNRALRLNQEAVEDLQFRIGYFFGRYALSNDEYMLNEAERRLIREEEEEKRRRQQQQNQGT